MIANLTAWYRNSLRGTKVVYHTGFLARDREAKARDAAEKEYYKELNAASNYMFKLAEEGRVALVQKRLEPNKFEYIAVKVK
jgi:hypothetical protein